MVIRPQIEDLEGSFLNTNLFNLINKLHTQGVKHLEVAWSQHPRWTNLVYEIQDEFHEISLGAASITNTYALKAVAEAKLSYAMTPFWDLDLQKEAISLQQVLVPGVFSPTEIKQAMQFGCRIIKLFPASILGIKYLDQLSLPMSSIPYVIAAGGLTAKDIQPWLQAGFGAVAIGRKLIKNEKLDSTLLKWLTKQKEVNTSEMNYSNDSN